MLHFAAPVKCPLAEALGRVSRRTLWAIAYYHELPANHETAPGALAAQVAAQILGGLHTARLAARLTAHDLSLFAQLCAGAPSGIPPGDLQFPWHLAHRRAPLAALRPIERLMALGLVCPIRRPPAVALLIPAELVDPLHAWRAALPALPALDPIRTDLPALIEDAVSALAALVATPRGHTPRGGWFPALRRHLDQTCAAPGLPVAVARRHLPLL